MARLIKFFIVILFAGLLFQSCKKCVTCSYEYAVTGVSKSEHLCGDKDEVEEIKTTWKAYEESLGVVVTCVDE